VIVAVCVALFTTAVTTPVCDTLTSGLLDAQKMVRPVRALPPASNAVAIRVVVPPSTTVAGEGVSVIEEIGTAVTFTVAVPLTPSVVAVIVAEPDETPVTTPAELTVAIAVLDEDHVMIRPAVGSGVVRSAANRLTVMGCVWPTDSVRLPGLTVTSPTGMRVTVYVPVPDAPSILAVIVKPPSAMPTTRPVDDTVPMLSLLDAHVAVLPGSSRPVASSAVAVSCSAPPC
jgi:hypothetical protein